MLADEESTEPTFNKNIRIAKVREYEFDQVLKDIDNIIETALTYDQRAVVAPYEKDCTRIQAGKQPMGIRL